MSPIISADRIQQFQAINLLLDPGHVAGPVVIPLCCQVVLKWQLADGKTANNVLYGKYAGTFTPTTVMADAIKNTLTAGAQWTALAALLGTTCGLSAVTLRDVGTPNNAVFTSATTVVPGTGAAPILPSEVAICVTLRTAKTGQANRGRMYLSGFVAAAVAAGDVISAAAMTAVNNWVNNIPTTLAPQGLTWSIGQPARTAYQGATGTQHPARAATSTPIVSYTVRDNHWDSQRRRGLR